MTNQNFRTDKPHHDDDPTTEEKPISLYIAEDRTRLYLWMRINEHFLEQFDNWGESDVIRDMLNLVKEWFRSRVKLTSPGTKEIDGLGAEIDRLRAEIVEVA